ncbi:MAG: uroporphyrinogen decarboxylase family protein [Acidobacteria bacterium]|nr:uroporphyrinogen decarboxylase family protein [Acidobacteriota bacterium]
MNSLERVFAAVTGHPQDRPAFLLNSTLYGSRLAGHPLPVHYSEARAYAEGQIAVLETFGPDLLLSPFLAAPLGEAFGSKATPPRGYAPNIAEYAARSVDEALRLPLPDVDSHPRLVYLRDCVRILAARHPGEVPVAGLLLSPVDLPPLIIGMDAWLDTLLADPDLARRFLDHLTPFFVALGNAFLSDGATLLALTANFANPSLVPRRVVEEVSRPALQAAFGQIRGPMILHHGGPTLVPHLDAYLGLPGLAGFLVDARDSLVQARSLAGEAPVILGNLDGPGLEHLDPESVGIMCDRILADRAQDSHFVLATSAADISLATPPENLQAITDAVCRSRPIPP